jgi:hypothetical protein
MSFSYESVNSAAYIEDASCLSRSEFKRLSYEGFYTMVLEKDGEIVSVALLRSGLSFSLCLYSTPLTVGLLQALLLFLSYLSRIITWIRLVKPVAQ